MTQPAHDVDFFDQLISQLEHLKEDLNVKVAGIDSALTMLAQFGRASRQRRAPVSGRPASRRRRTRGGAAPSPQLRALRKLQGQYMGAFKSLTAAQRAQVKKKRAEAGVKKALDLANSFRKK
jgi:hypothetical protein